MPSLDNPADIGSRGSTCDKLTASSWWTGPEWLANEPSTWSNTDLHLKDYKEKEERDGPDCDNTEPTFATLEDALHGYDVPIDNALFKKPLNEHAYAKQERKRKGRVKSIKKLDESQSQALLQPIG